MFTIPLTILWWDYKSKELNLFYFFPSVKIQYVQLFTDHLVVYEREMGLPRITVFDLPPVGEPLERFQGGRHVDFIDPVYSVDLSESQFSSSILRFSYGSLRTPWSVYDYDMNTGISVLKKIETVSQMWSYNRNSECCSLPVISEYTLYWPHPHIPSLPILLIANLLGASLLFQQKLGNLHENHNIAESVVCGCAAKLFWILVGKNPPSFFLLAVNYSVK